jgi:hypothetical protein
VSSYFSDEHIIQRRRPMEIRAGRERLQAQWDFFVQNTHPGTIQLDGDTAAGRAYIQELAPRRGGTMTRPVPAPCPGRC